MQENSLPLERTEQLPAQEIIERLAQAEAAARATAPAGAQADAVYPAVDPELLQQARLAVEAAEQDRRWSAESDAVFSALSDAVILYDTQGTVRRTNPAARSLLGFDLSGLDQQGIIERLSIRDAEGRLVSGEQLTSSRALQGQTARGEKFTLTNRQGRTRTVFASAAPLIVDGERTGAMVVLHDVTEQERLQKELAIEQARMQTLLENAPAGVVMCDPQGEILLANPAAQTMVGGQVTGTAFSPEAGYTLHRSDGSPHPPEELPLVRAIRERTLVRNQELLIRTSLGDERLLLVNSAPVLDEQGGVDGAVAVMQDITERMRAERVIRESEEHLRLVLNNLFTFVGELTPEGVLVEANRAPLEAAGIEYQDVIGKRFEDTYWWNYAPQVQARIRRAIERAAAGRSSRFDIEAQMSGGRLITLDFMIAPLFDEHGRVRFLIPSAVDITSRKEAMQALQESEELRRLAMQGAQLGTWADDLVEHRSYWDERTREIFGVTPDEPVSLDKRFALIHPDDRERARRELEKAIAPDSDGVYEVEKRVVHDDGSIRWVSTKGQVTFKGRGGQRRAVRLVGVVNDITLSKQAEEARREIEERFRSVLENSLDVAYRRNLQTDRYDYLSPAVEQVLGLSESQMNTLSTEKLFERIHPDDRKNVREGLTQSVKTGRSKVEYRLLQSDGQYRWLADHMTVIKDPDGKPRYRTGIVRDITDIRNAYEQLQAWSRELEERVAQRTEEVLELQRRLLDSIEAERTGLAREIHDGPMQDIYALIYRLAAAAGQAQGETQEEMKAIQNELVVVNQTLRNISQELLPPTLTKMGLGKAIQAHVENLQPANPELEIHFELQDDCRLADRVRLALYRIYQIAITNVIRHAQATRVDIRLKAEGEHCVLEIEDNGVGFAVPASWMEMARSGHMGLVSAQERARQVDGRLEVDSQPGRGVRLAVKVQRG